MSGISNESAVSMKTSNIYISPKMQQQKTSTENYQTQKSAYIPFKRLIGFICALLLLVAISPLLLVIAILIKLDSEGPVFYVSKRMGEKQRVFNFYKFRTMRKNADKQVQKLMNKNQYAADKSSGEPLFFKIENDPRITKLGSFLRRTSLDELPQIFNILKGDMYFIGNRPLPLYEAESLNKDEWKQRFNAPAGITGLWQIEKRGKGEMSVSERIALDVQYANECSLITDLRILIKTPLAMIQEENV